MNECLYGCMHGTCMRGEGVCACVHVHEYTHTHTHTQNKTYITAHPTKNTINGGMGNINIIL